MSRPSTERVSILALGVLSLVTAALVGCGVQTGLPVSEAGAHLQGKVFGGQQPVSGASIVLYAAGTTGNGTGAVNLLAPHVVTTSASGSFDISGDYVCPSATTQVYLVARGGNPGLAPGTSNPALLMMVALGDCSGLNSSTFVVVNEVTTVAAAWALSQFLSPGAIAGASSTNSIGLRNAFAAAANLANSASGLAPGANLPAGAVTETVKLYTLANILAPCVNSDGSYGCDDLFASATANGSVPSTTLDAALAIVRAPAANVKAIFSAGPPKGPFQPVLSSAPSDWTMSITYGSCSPACGGLNIPGALAIDSQGSVWVANYFGSVVSRFSPSGVPASPLGFYGMGLRQSYGITVDAQDNAWVTNEQSVTGASNSHLGSISKFSPTGAELSGFGYTGGGVYYPQAVAADSTGAIWVADYGHSAATLLASDGSPVSGGSGYGTSALHFPQSVAIDATHNAWFATQQGAVRVSPVGAVSIFPCCNSPIGIAVDQSGSVWIADDSASSIVQMTPAGAVANTVSLQGALSSPNAIAIDGSGNVWSANYTGNTITEIVKPSGGTLTPIFFGLDAPFNEPYGIAVDAGGSLWISNAGDDTLTQIVGVASPIRTPLLGPPTQP